MLKFLKECQTRATRWVRKPKATMTVMLKHYQTLTSSETSETSATPLTRLMVNAPAVRSSSGTIKRPVRFQKYVSWNVHFVSRSEIRLVFSSFTMFIKLPLLFDRRPVSLFGWVSDYRAGGRGFEPRPDQHSGSLNNWAVSAAFLITSANGKTL